MTKGRSSEVRNRVDTAGDQPAPETSETEFYSRAYSAPESEQFTSGPYVPADSSLYDYDSYESGRSSADQPAPPRWPWVVGVVAIIAAIALVVSVSVLVTRTDTDNLAKPGYLDHDRRRHRCRTRSPPRLRHRHRLRRLRRPSSRRHRRRRRR